MDLKQTKSTILHYVQNDIPTMLWGAPGIGKSDMVREVANTLEMELIDVRATLLDPVDLRGVPHVENGVTKWAAPGFLPSDPDACGILFLDELNAAPQAVQVACYQLILDRRIGEYELPRGFRIIAAGNRQSDRAAAQRMPSALANRFAHIDVEADHAAWLDWSTANGIAPIVHAFIQFRAELLHNMVDSDLRTFPTPRAWAQVAKIANAPESIRHGLVSGLVGAGAAAEFESFVRTWENMPNVADILKNPTTAPIPTDIGTLYALTCALSRKADQGNIGAIVTYAERLQTEFTIICVVDAVKRDPDLCGTQAFRDWAINHQDVTL